MNRFRIPAQPFVLVLLATLPFGCNDARTIADSSRTGAPAASTETGGVSPTQAVPAPAAEKEAIPPPESVKQKRQPLDLSVDAVPRGRQTTPHTYPDPEKDSLLPDLFTSQKAEEPVSVKGELLMKENADGLTNPVDGAGVSIQFNTK